MKSFFTFIMALLLSTLLCACAAKTGHQFLEKMSDQDIAAKIIKGQTTKEQIKQMFGDPEDVDILPDSRETWLYKFVRSEAKGVNFVPYVNYLYSGTNDNVRKLKILFKSDNTVENFAFSSSKCETKKGLFQ